MNLRQLKIIEWLLRIGVFMCFIGHGYFAISKHPSWLPYLEVVGFTGDFALNVMVAIGALDIIVAVVTLLKPMKYVLLWACLWGFLTALARPLSGEPIAAFVERGLNWVTPLVLYFLLVMKEQQSVEK